MPPRCGIPHPGSTAALLLRPNERKFAMQVSTFAGYRARPLTSSPGDTLLRGRETCLWTLEAIRRWTERVRRTNATHPIP